MSIRELCHKLKCDEITEEQFVETLKSIRAFSKEDRFKLEVIDHAPFSMWACDKNYIIKYWEGECSRIYGMGKLEAIGKRYLELFVSEEERNQSELDCNKIIEGKSEPGEFINNVAIDFDSLGREITLMTNCFRVYDRETNEWLQAEIALPTDIEKVTKKHKKIIANYRELQEWKIRQREDMKNYFETFLNELEIVARTANRLAKKKNIVGEEKEELQEILEQGIALRSDVEEKQIELLEVIDSIKSKEQFENEIDTYKRIKDSLRIRLQDIQESLEEIGENFENEINKKIAVLGVMKSEKVELCFVKCDELVNFIQSKLQKVYSNMEGLELRIEDKDSEKFVEKIDKYNAQMADVRRLRVEVTEKISSCKSVGQIETVEEEFKKSIRLIRERVEERGYAN